MRFSHSAVDCYKTCPYRYRLRYNERLKTLPPTDADNALILGTAMHTGIERGTDAGISQYFNSFPIIDDAHINEAIKLEYLIPKVREILPPGEFELELKTGNFIGYIDLTAHNSDGTVDIYDFKYTKNIANYNESPQLHVYKHYFELVYDIPVRNLYYVHIPKIAIRQKQTEDLEQFRQRLRAELKQSEVQLVPVKFDPGKVQEFMNGAVEIMAATEFPKSPSHLCNWCEYEDYCLKGVDYMILPSTERRNIEKISKKVIWLYGAPFSGKTVLSNKFPSPLMLNTDGNIKFVDAPYIPIRDEITVEGRQTKRTLAWTVFKNVIAELERKQNEFRTVTVDLVEDAYEHCRIFIYDRDGITHESDNSFKYYDVVRTEFLSTLKRLTNLDYENIILISHEDTSKDITKKTGDKITAIKPNLPEKVAAKVAGMVDIVARVVADGEERTLSFKTNEVVFGGGRLMLSDLEIPLDYDALMRVYADANDCIKSDNRAPRTEPSKPSRGRKSVADVKTTEDKPVENKSKESFQGNDSAGSTGAAGRVPDESAGIQGNAQETSGEATGNVTRRTRRVKPDTASNTPENTSEKTSGEPNAEPNPVDSSAQKVQEIEPASPANPANPERKTRKRRE